MSTLIDGLVAPYKAYKNRRKIEESLKFRENIDTKSIQEEQKALLVERDLDLILSQYIDNKEAQSLELVFDKEYLTLATEYLDKQQIQYTVINETRMVVRSE